MAEIENIHCPICTQPIPSSWQNGLPPALATDERRGDGVLVSECMFYMFQRDQTEIGGVTLICNTAFAFRQNSRRGSTSAPLCPTYSESSKHKDSPGTTFHIPYLLKKLSKSRLSDRFFGLFW